MTAASDCEACRHGWVTQPANTLSSLAYVVAGADLMRRPDADRAFAGAVVAVGLGSVAYHGPGGAWGKWAHDASLIAMLGLLALSDVTLVAGRDRPPGAVAGVVGGAMAAAHPATSEVAQLSVGALAVAAEARRYARMAGTGELAGSGGLFAAGLVVQVLGRTGRPWCRPGSFAQPHAAWHVLSAASLWLRRRPDQVPVPGTSGTPSATSGTSSGWWRKPQRRRRWAV